MFPEPECESGYPWYQIREILGNDKSKELSEWMYGQTMMLCDGRRYDHEAKEYYETHPAHGPVVYTWDLQRFMDGRPVID